MQGTFPSQQQSKQTNINPPIISLSKFPRNSFTKLKIKTKNMNIHKLKIPPIQTHSFVSNENKHNVQQSKLPPLVNNTSSNLNYRSRTPLSLTGTRKLNDINSTINIFNKNEIQIISSLKNELKSKNEENQRLLNTIKTMHNNHKMNGNYDIQCNKELEQQNMILNDEIKKMQNLLEHIKHPIIKENKANKENEDENIIKINKLKIQIEQLQKNVDAQILQNKKLKETIVSLNSSRANMQKVQYDLQNKIQNLQNIIDDKENQISQLNDVIEQFKKENNNNSISNKNESHSKKTNTSRSISSNFSNKINKENNIRFKILEYFQLINFTIDASVQNKQDNINSSDVPKPTVNILINDNSIENQFNSFSFVHKNKSFPKTFAYLSRCKISNQLEFVPITSNKINSMTHSSIFNAESSVAFTIVPQISAPKKKDIYKENTTTYDNNDNNKVPLATKSPRSDTNNDDDDEVIIKTKNTFALLQQHHLDKRVPHSQISISFHSKPKAINTVSTNQISFFIYSNTTNHSEKNSLIDPLEKQIPFNDIDNILTYPNFISENEIETTIYLLLKTIQSKNLLPAMLCDEILQLSPFTIENISSFLVTTLQLDKDSSFIVNRLIYGMGYKENMFSYDILKSHFKLVFNDNLSNIPFDKKVIVSNEVDKNALTDVISLCVRYDQNYLGFISFESFSNIIVPYMKKNYITQKGYEYLIYSMKKRNEQNGKKRNQEVENLMMLYYKSLTSLIPKLKDSDNIILHQNESNSCINLQEEENENKEKNKNEYIYIEEESNKKIPNEQNKLKNSDIKNSLHEEASKEKNVQIRRKSKKQKTISDEKIDQLCKEHATLFVDDVFEWALMEREINDIQMNHLLSSYRDVIANQHVKIENMFKDEN